MNRTLLSIGLIGIVGAVLHVRSPAPVRAAAVGTPLSAAALACDVYCQEPQDCEPGWHDAWDPPPSPNATRNGGAHIVAECREGTCDVMHGPLCGGFGGDGFSAVELETLRAFLARGDAAGMHAILAQHAESIMLNADRSAIQVLSCAGDVVAHLPATKRLVAALIKARGTGADADQAVGL
jgi:hypothetical protein